MRMLIGAAMLAGWLSYFYARPESRRQLGQEGGPLGPDVRSSRAKGSSSDRRQPAGAFLIDAALMILILVL